MIRVRHLINKDSLPSWIDNEDIVKIIIKTKASRKLRNQEVCEIYAFYSIRNQMDAINNILGSCAKVIKDNEKENFLTGAEHAFLNGIQSLKGDGFISKSKISRLIEIQTKHKINLSISKQVKDFVKSTSLYDKNEKDR